MFKLSKKKNTRIVSNLFKLFKVNNKDTRMASGASVVDFEHISVYSNVIAEF